MSGVCCLLFFFRRCQSSCSISTGCCWKFLLLLMSDYIIVNVLFTFQLLILHPPVHTVQCPRLTVQSSSTMSCPNMWKLLLIFTNKKLSQQQAPFVWTCTGHSDIWIYYSPNLANYRVICLCLWESCRVFSDFGNFDRFSQGNVTLIANRATSGTSPTSSFWHKEKKFHFCLFLKQQQQKRSWTPRIMIPFF